MSAQLSPEQIAHLPRALQSKPEVRGMTLAVYPDGPGRFRVPGRQQIYELHLSADGKHILCNCIASLRQRCAHKFAVHYYLRQERTKRLEARRMSAEGANHGETR